MTVAGGFVLGATLALAERVGADAVSTGADVRHGIGVPLGCALEALVEALLEALVEGLLDGSAEVALVCASPQFVNVRPPSAAAISRRRRSRIALVSSESPTRRAYRRTLLRTSHWKRDSFVGTETRAVRGEAS